MSDILSYQKSAVNQEECCLILAGFESGFHRFYSVRIVSLKSPRNCQTSAKASFPYNTPHLNVKKINGIFELSGSDTSSFIFQDNRYIHNVQIHFALRKIDGALTQACPAFLRGVPFHRMDRTAVSSKIGRSGHYHPSRYLWRPCNHSDGFIIERRSKHPPEPPSLSEHVFTDPHLFVP